MYSGLLQNSNQDDENSELLKDNSYFEPSIHDPLGLIAEEDALKLKMMFPEYNTRRFRYLIKTHQIEKLEEIALNEDFVLANLDFCRSGDLIYLVLNYYEFDLLYTLIQFGYSIPSNFLTRGIKDGETGRIETMIDRNLYHKREVSLAFWLCLDRGFLRAAERLFEKEENVKTLFQGFSLSSSASVSEFLTAVDPVNKIIIVALEIDEDEIASDLLIRFPAAIDQRIVKIALSLNCVETLKVIWTGHLTNTKNSVRKRAKKSLIWDKLGADVFDSSERRKFNKRFRIPSILHNLLKANLVQRASQVLDWPEACDETGTIQVLIQFEQEELMSKYLKNTNLEITSSEFLCAFDKGFYKACVKMMEFEEPRGSLSKRSVQKSLLELLTEGDIRLCAIQMLNLITHNNWDPNLTQDLCSKLKTIAEESDDLILCNNMLMFGVLTIETLMNLSQVSDMHKHRCLECADIYVKLVSSLQDTINDTEALKFFLLDRDCQGRSCLVIIAENSLLSLLEDVKIGAIVTDLWKGRDAKNLWEASRFYNSIMTDEEFLGPIDSVSPYRFCFDIWIGASNLRSLLNTISAMFLLSVYTALIIEGTDNKNFSNLSALRSTHSLLRLSQILILGLISDLFMQYLFSVMTKRRFSLDAMRTIDIIIFFQILLILAGFQNSMGPGKTFPNADPDLYVGLNYSLENLFIWIKFLLTLITFQSFGMFLFSIFGIMKKMVSFYFLFACFSIWFAAVFTALFSEQIPDSYSSFWISMRTLYSASLGGFSFQDFQSSSNMVLGMLILGLYLLITNVMLLNLFIALFEAVYKRIDAEIESTYVSVLILQHDKFRWDEKYSCLTVLTTPFSILNGLVYPFLVASKDIVYFNKLAAKFLYSSVYGVFCMAMYVILNLVFLPFVYIKGCWKYSLRPDRPTVSLNEPENSASVFDIKRLLIWVVFGVPILVFYIFKDLVTFWEIVLKDYDEKINTHPFASSSNIKIMKETLKRITQNYVTPDEVANLWVYTKTLMTCEPELPEDLNNALDFCVFFISSTKEKTVDVRSMEKILDSIDEDDLERFSYIRIPFINKGIRVFRECLEGIEVEGTVIPKKIGNPGGPVDITNMKNIYKIMLEMGQTIKYYKRVMKKMKVKAGII